MAVSSEVRAPASGDCGGVEEAASKLAMLRRLRQADHFRSTTNRFYSLAIVCNLRIYSLANTRLETSQDSDCAHNYVTSREFHPDILTLTFFITKFGNKPRNNTIYLRSLLLRVSRRFPCLGLLLVVNVFCNSSIPRRSAALVVAHQPHCPSDVVFAPGPVSDREQGSDHDQVPVS